MKIIIDINHPAHVHYFRNFIKEMQNRGHEFRVINRDSEMINYLLDYYKIDHVTRNPRPKNKGTLSSLSNLGKMTLKCIKESISFRPDLYLGFASSACAITSKLFNRPCILLDDTEHNVINHKIYLQFCSCVLTPFYFNKDLGPKQIIFNAFVEQLYLHSSVYKPSNAVLDRLGIKPREYILFRYISYDAHHDLVAKPLSEKFKKKIVDESAKENIVYVSHESNPSPYPEYDLKIAPEEMHDVEANAKYMITEGATMATESFVLGIPSIYINPLRIGYCDIQKKLLPETIIGNLNEDSVVAAINKINEKLCDLNVSVLRNKIESSTINPTKFLVWFVENYPQSEDIVRKNPHYMNRFCND